MILSHSIFPTGLPLQSVLWKLYPLFFIYLREPHARFLHLPSCHLWTHDHKTPQSHLTLFLVLMKKININECKCAQAQPACSLGRNLESNVSTAPYLIRHLRRAVLPLADAYASAATSQTTPLDHIQPVLPENAHVLSTYLHVSGTVWVAAVPQQGF